MSLQTKFGFSKIPTGIRTKDLTGLFNSLVTDPHYNPTGWQDSSTGFIAATTQAILLVAVPDPVTLMPQATPLSFNVYNTLPNYLYASKDVDLSGGDGAYYLTVSIINTGFTDPLKYSEYKLFTPDADCCIQKLSDASVCNSSKKKAYQEAFDIWMTMKYSACCGKIQEAVTELKKLQRICKKNGCGCC